MRQVLRVGGGRASCNPRIHATYPLAEIREAIAVHRPARSRRQGRADAVIREIGTGVQSIVCHVAAMLRAPGSVASVRVPMRLSRPVLLVLGAVMALTSAYQAGHRRRLLPEAVRLGLVAPLRAHRAADLQFRLRRAAARLRSGLRQGYGDSGWPQDYAGTGRCACAPATASISPSATTSVASGCIRMRARARRAATARPSCSTTRPTAAASRRWSTWRAAVRANADGVPLSQDAGAGLHVQTGAVVGGNARRGTRATRTRRPRWQRCARGGGAMPARPRCRRGLARRR